MRRGIGLLDDGLNVKNNGLLGYRWICSLKFFNEVRAYGTVCGNYIGHERNRLLPKAKMQQ